MSVTLYRTKHIHRSKFKTFWNKNNYNFTNDLNDNTVKTSKTAALRAEEVQLID